MKFIVISLFFIMSLFAQKSSLEERRESLKPSVLSVLDSLSLDIAEEIFFKNSDRVISNKTKEFMYINKAMLQILKEIPLLNYSPFEKTSGDLCNQRYRYSKYRSLEMRVSSDGGKYWDLFSKCPRSKLVTKRDGKEGDSCVYDTESEVISLDNGKCHNPEIEHLLSLGFTEVRLIEAEHFAPDHFPKQHFLRFSTPSSFLVNMATLQRRESGEESVLQHLFDSLSVPKNSWMKYNNGSVVSIGDELSEGAEVSSTILKVRFQFFELSECGMGGCRHHRFDVEARPDSSKPSGFSVRVLSDESLEYLKCYKKIALSGYDRECLGNALLDSQKRFPGL